MDLDELRVFVSVVERGSLAAASKSLRFPIATLRRRINELEARLGVKLLERNRQGAVPTGAGVVLVEKARSLLSEVQSLSELVRGAGAEPSGHVGLAIPHGMPAALVASFLHVLVAVFPRVSWQIRCVEDPVAALSHGSHVAFCVADRPPDGPWSAKALLHLDERLLATSAYLERHGTPADVEALRGHRLLVWEGSDRRGDELPIADGSRLPIVPAVRMNDIFLLRQAALRGLGIVFAPDGPLPLEFLLGEEDLVRVLDGKVKGRTTVWLVAPAASFHLPRTGLVLEKLIRVLVDFGKRSSVPA